MFFAHIPAGYLVSRLVIRRQQPAYIKWIVLAGLIGGGFPDIDLLYLHFLDSTPQHHHTYWTHMPYAWLGGMVLTWVIARSTRASIRLGLTAFMFGWLSHLLLDSIAGDIWWLYPFIDQAYSLVNIKAQYQPWWLNYLLHWTMALELAIIAAAVGLEIKSPRLCLRYTLPKPLLAAGLIGMGLILMESLWPAPDLRLPVQGATYKDWNATTYWHPHWGASGVHKGIDIFSARGTAVHAAQGGWVVFQGHVSQGGNVTAVLTPRGWLHYYAHLDRSVASTGTWVTANETIGFVGNSGNAKGKPTHLHYSILSPIPRLQSFRFGPQGWKRPFYRNPDALLKASG